MIHYNYWNAHSHQTARFQLKIAAIKWTERDGKPLLTTEIETDENSEGKQKAQKRKRKKKKEKHRDTWPNFDFSGV